MMEVQVFSLCPNVDVYICSPRSPAPSPSSDIIADISQVILTNIIIMNS